MSEDGQPVELPVEFCWRCGVPVFLGLVSIEEHNDRAHPPVPPQRQAPSEESYGAHRA